MTDLQFDFIKTMCVNIEELFPTLPSDTILFIACQSALETAYGNSKLCRLFNNYFGMKNPMARPSTSQVRGLAEFEWANYTDCYSSIVDYFLAITFRKPLASEFENLNLFKSFIKNWYCSERDYIDKVTKIFNQFKSKQNEQRNSN